MYAKCSSDPEKNGRVAQQIFVIFGEKLAEAGAAFDRVADQLDILRHLPRKLEPCARHVPVGRHQPHRLELALVEPARGFDRVGARRSEEHTSELQSLMRISYAVFCLKQKKKKKNHTK